MRRYTGFNGDSGRTTPGLAAMVAAIEAATNGGLWNNGTYVNRPMRGKKSTSVHATGRAVDLSWRNTDGRGFGDYTAAKAVIDRLVLNADLLLLELVLDYDAAPFGQGWRCDRNAWVQYTRPTIHPTPGDWFHIEIAPRRAQDARWYTDAIATVLGQAPAPTPAPTAPKYPGRVSKAGSKGETVKKIQARLRVRGFNPGPVDGVFGPRTTAAVTAFQEKFGLKVDGLVGPKTWATLFDA